MRASKYTTRLRYQGLLTAVSKGHQMTSLLIKQYGGQSCIGFVLKKMGYLHDNGYWNRQHEYNDTIVDELIAQVSQHRKQYTVHQKEVNQTLAPFLSPNSEPDLFNTSVTIKKCDLCEYIDWIKSEFELSAESRMVLHLIKQQIK